MPTFREPQVSNWQARNTILFLLRNVTAGTRVWHHLHPLRNAKCFESKILQQLRVLHTEGYVVKEKPELKHTPWVKTEKHISDDTIDYNAVIVTVPELC